MAQPVVDWKQLYRDALARGDEWEDAYSYLAAGCRLHHLDPKQLERESRARVKQALRDAE